MPKAESLLYVSLGPSPEGAPSLGTTQNGIARCKRAVSQRPHNKFEIPESYDDLEMKAEALAWCEVANKKTKKYWSDDNNLMDFLGSL